MLKRLFLDRWLRPAPPPPELSRPAGAAGGGVPAGGAGGGGEEPVAEVARLRREGGRLLEEKNTGAAVDCLRCAADLAPRDAGIQFELGQALQRAGLPEEALESYGRAIDLRHDYIDAINAHAVVCLELKRLEDAQDSFNVALTFDERSASACFGLGLIAWERGSEAEARRHLLRAAELDPGLVAAHVTLGTMSYACGRFEEAVAHFETAEKLALDLPELQSNLGLALQRVGRVDEAIAHLRRAVALRPGFAEASFNLGVAYHDAGRLEQAIASYREACTALPGFAEAWSNLGNVHRDRGALDEALDCYRTALEHRADYAEAHYNSGVTLHTQGRASEAIVSYERACALRPGYPEARLNLALARLTTGDLARGWEGYDSRFDQTVAENYVNVARFSFPLWRGETLTGKRILVWGEQGIGDELRFGGLYGEVARAASLCVIECSPKLLALFARSVPAATVASRAGPPCPATRDDFDFHTPAGSLARWLRPSVASFPDRRGYLAADPARVASWRAHIAGVGSGLKVGFSWRSHNLKGDRALSFARIEQWEPILRARGVHFFSVQYDECGEELERAKNRFGVELHTFSGVDLFNDLDESAAILAALDLVITAPTAVSLLASALGVETWEMDYGPSWHMLGTDRDPWFLSAKHYKRAWNQGWEEIMRKVAHDLQRAADSHADASPSAPAAAVAEAAPARRATAAEALRSGAAHYGRGALDAAEAAWRQALEADPESVAARVNLGLVCYQQGRLEEAVRYQRDALARDPQYPEAHLNLGLALLARGELVEGWTEYEWRFDQATAEDRARTFPFPRWQGEDLGGKTILVWKEQSVGSQLVYAGMFRDLVARGGFCIIECTPKLVPLFARSFPECDVVPRTEPAHAYTQHGIDFQISAASLGRWLRPTLAAFPRHQGYLHADPDRVARWRERLRLLGTGPKIGFSWRSINVSAERSLACTTLDQWEPILRTHGVHFVNLQYDDCAAEVEAARGRLGVPLNRFADLDLFNDLDGAAALTGALDLVISAPTAVTDLSAALGVPTWQLHHGIDWKMHGCDRHPWFPALRRFQRGPVEPWEEVLREVAAQLHAWSASRGI